MEKHYLNLTNGIEWIPELTELGIPYSFIRLETSSCERKMWDKILQQLDADFLMNLALGNNCIVYDASSRKVVSRSQYQGLEMVRYILNRLWFDKHDADIFVNGCFATDYFKKVYDRLDDKTVLKLKYFKKFLNRKGELNLSYRCKKSIYDSKYEFYNHILDQHKI